MKKLFLTPLILSAALMTATACSEDGPVTDGQEQATPGEEGNEGGNEEGNVDGTITTSIESFDEYDIVFVGYPIWYGHMATPMQTFLHNHASLLADKRIALFASSGGSGISTSERDAAALVPGATLEESLLLTSSSSGNMETRIPEWLESLGASREEKL